MAPAAETTEAGLLEGPTEEEVARGPTEENVAREAGLAADATQGDGVSCAEAPAPWAIRLALGGAGRGREGSQPLSQTL